MKNTKVLIILAFIAVYLIWGSTYLFNKMLLAEIPAFELSGIRFFAAGLIILLLAAAKIKKQKVTLRQTLNACFAGFIFLTLGNGLLVCSLKYLDSGFAALLIAAQPLNLLIMLRIWKGQKITKKSMVGVALGIVGIYLLMYNQGFGEGFSWKGITLVFMSLISWGYASIYVGDADLPKNQFVNSAIQMIFSGLCLMILSPIIGEEWVNPLGLTSKAYAYYAFLIFFGSIIAFSAFNFLLKNVSPEKVATSAYVNPLVAVVLGYLVLQEKLNYLTILSAFVLLAGVYFINSAKAESNTD